MNKSEAQPSWRQHFMLASSRTEVKLEEEDRAYEPIMSPKQKEITIKVRSSYPPKPCG